ncbi:MAG: ion transporter [Bacteroidales bacterium]|nr:ion transporter [Bacteroidales bacterium]MBN2820472.1 ion transporter [Bacteroidales bacterium]
MTKLRKRLFDIVFEADTRAGKTFDIALLIIISLSILVVLLESVPKIRHSYYHLLKMIEWGFTIIFLMEYLVRILISYKRWKYITSFYGIIDFISILPAFLSLIFVGAHSLIIVRAFRLLRVFRVLKVSRYTNAGQTLVKALAASRAKISVFLFAIITIVLFVGTLMYIIEGEANGFTSIPKAIYWAIVTLTTVGYGDLTPATTIGQFISSILMIIGYAIIAVPTGIITVELSKNLNKSTQVCPSCYKENHDEDAVYCKKCGSRLND